MQNNKKREDGYYWVKITERDQWELALWRDGRWRIFMSIFAREDPQLYKIDEHKILDKNS